MVASKEVDEEKHDNIRKKLNQRERRVEQLMDPMYKDERSPACFTSREPLWREARRRHPSERITRREVERYLARQRVYTLHRQARRRFTRLPTLAAGLHTDWQADLADFRRLKAQNGGYSYLLVCIDALSRQLFVEPVRSKCAEEMVRAFRRVFHRCGFVPWRLVTDRGREFTASAVQRLFRAEEVRHRCQETSPLWHAGMAERANRSIKERLYRYFTHRGTPCWTGVVQQVVTALNASPNSSIFGMRPRDVCFRNAERLRRRLAERAHVERSGSSFHRVRFRVGDRVRIERHRHAFRKGYLPRFTDEVFTVARVFTSRAPITYQLRDADGESISGLFYAQDLCLVLPPITTANAGEKVYNIERVLKRRRRQGVEECFVKWEGYSSAHNAWIPATSII
jgi:Integrase core domain/Chromo (CHRromatin Organisation MOdifier) domain